jgi:hypothetical protein
MMQTQELRAKLQSLKDATAVTVPDVARLDGLKDQIASAEVELKDVEA